MHHLVDVAPFSNECRDAPDTEETEFSDAVFEYISRILMEEDIEEKTCMLQDSLDLLSAEKSFYEVLGKKQFRMGIEESSKFLPNQAPTKLLPLKPNRKIDKRDRLGASERKESLHREEGNTEERSSKQAFAPEESVLRSDAFDVVLLSDQGEGLARLMNLRASLKNGVNEIEHKIQEPKAGRGRGKKKRGKVEVVDVRTLLIQCAQAVASNDHRSANALLNEIRKHASPFGNGTQRLAHYFANGLEARLAGTGSQICRGLVNRKTTAADMLNAYQLYLAACPFQRYLLTPKFW
ncbi:hypothetical protein EUGRSUZ_K01383 [Eucalyptus grandis]|uniref:Uncharacterized protein n=2 Tax=Eucalyptus grandis TaxID=71139 RepID=A0ACC3IW29_EUCGR|nr:hypothetical protein EUGRSUZ_K01383 [Eucalyptus grandis]